MNVDLRNSKLEKIITGRFPTMKSNSGGVCSVCFSPDGLSIISGSYDGTLKVWKTKNSKLQ